MQSDALLSGKVNSTWVRRSRISRVSGWNRAAIFTLWV